MSAGATEAAQGAYPEHLRDAVDVYLRAIQFSLEPATGGLEEAMRYSLLAGGKRIRPVLCLATARAIGVQAEEMMPLAGAIEMIHTYSLIHDDLPAMDDDDLRRGRPTCHRAFGEDVAILAGDALYAEAFRHLLGNQRAQPERLLAAATRLAFATGVNGMVGGQYLDTRIGATAQDAQGQSRAARGQRGMVDGSGATLRRIHELKTGELIGASVSCVLLLAGAQQQALQAFGRFAAELGVLFQIVDDILDVTGTDSALGKPSGSDERSGRQTYVSKHGIEGARRLADESHRAARQALAAATEAVPAAAASRSSTELEQIADFIYLRTS